MKKLHLLLLLVLLSLTSMAQQKDFYQKTWEEIAKLESKNKYKNSKAIREKLDQIYQTAKKEGNHLHILKALIKKSDEIYGDTVLEHFAQELKSTKDPSIKAILQHIIASLYIQQYQNFLTTNGTPTLEDPKDYKTWSRQAFLQHAVQRNNLALKDKHIQSVKMDHYEELLTQKGSKEKRQLKPTLFDFLAYQTLKDYSASQNSRQSIKAFKITPKYLTDRQTFLTQKIQTEDSLSYEHQSLVLYQRLLKMHLQDPEPSALIYADIQRILYIHQKLNTSDKDQKTIQQLQKIIDTYPNNPTTAIAYQEIAQIYHDQAPKYNPFDPNDPYKWYNQKALEACEKAIRKYPNDKIAIPECHNIKNEILEKRIVAFHMEEAILPHQPFLVSLKYANIPKIYWKIIKTEAKNEIFDFYNYKILRKYLEKVEVQTAIHQGEFDLRDDGDHQEHHTELNLPALDNGIYLIIFSTDPDFKKKNNITTVEFAQVTNLSYTRKIYKGNNYLYVINRQTGKPLSNVEISFYQNLKKEPDHFITDEGGKVKIPKTGFFFVLKKKDDHYSNYYRLLNDFEIRKNMYKYAYRYYPEEKEKDQTIVTLLTDRGIYRPEQNIHFKGIVSKGHDNKYKVRKNFKTKIILQNANYQELASQEVTTNEFGSFEGSFTIPNGLTGKYTLRCEDLYKTISVEEYKRPKFEVKIDPIEGTPKLNESVKVTGEAKAFSGAKVGDAKVFYTIYREARFPVWYYYWKGRYPTSPSQKIASGTLNTDQDGKFAFDFKALVDPKVSKDSDPVFVYKVTVDVTDINGETQSKTSQISIGYKSLEASVDIPEHVDIAQKTKGFAIKTQNLMGNFVPTKGVIKIYQKKDQKAFRSKLWSFADRPVIDESTYRKLFPNEQYSIEDDPNFVPKDLKGLTLLQSHHFDTSQDKTFRPDLKSLPLGRYVVIIDTKDLQGKPIRGQASFTLFNSHGSKVPTQDPLWVAPIKDKVEPKETASFVVGSKEKNHIYYEFVKANGEPIKNEWIQTSKQQKISIPIKESYRGNIFLNVWTVKNNRVEFFSSPIIVPFSNKELDISFSTFRDKLQPGQKEEWSLTIKGNKGDKVLAEMVATLYDASLDVFQSNDFKMGLYHPKRLHARWDWVPSTHGFFSHSTMPTPTLIDFKLHDDELQIDARLVPHSFMIRGVALESKNKLSLPSSSINTDKASFAKPKKATPKVQENPQPDPIPVHIRKNFNETAFFYPNLMTNADGEIVIKFRIPEALTRWKMLGLAHTQDLQVGTITKELVTQKELMVMPNAPRFFREGDHMQFSTKINSLTDKDLSGQVELQLLDALTMQPVDIIKGDKKQSFTIKAQQSTAVHWDIKIPKGLQALTYRVIAKAGNFSDGEEMTLPVVTNSMLVTESLPLAIRGKQNKTFTFEKLSKPLSATARHQRFTLEFSSNPAWYAVQALPYMIEYPYECAEQTFTRYYANSISQHILQKHPKIQQIFNTWKNIQPDALLSKLEKNQELKSTLLEETPWVLNAQSETQSKRNIALLMDLNRLAQSQGKSLQKLKKMQNNDGGFPWFEKMKSSRYITQHIVASAAHLQSMGIKISNLDFLQRAMDYMDKEMQKDFDQTKEYCQKHNEKMEDQRISRLEIQYIYARNHFLKKHPLSKKHQEAYNFYQQQVVKQWDKFESPYLQGMIALASHGEKAHKETVAEIIASLRARARHSEEMGMYWPASEGYYWYQAPIESQALLIEVFDVIAQDKQAVEDMKVWLLKQKQVQDWKTTKATAEACFALLNRGTNLLASDQLVDIVVGEEPINPTTRPDIKVEAGTGYFKTAWSAKEIQTKMAKIKVHKKDDGVAWGAAYWQYFEHLDKITKDENNPLQIKKALYIQKETDRGPVLTKITEKNAIQVGDLIKVRIEIRVDRVMEYVHLKDMRASTFEPIDVLSRSKYQNGLYYYQSTRDLATNFFIAHLPKGTHVFEYSLRASQVGDFSNGVTTMQCMYAPEFASHSQGIRVKVKR